MKTLNDISKRLYEKLRTYFRQKEGEPARLDLHDGEGGLIDLAHLAATTEAYFDPDAGLFPIILGKLGRRSCYRYGKYH